MCNSFRPRVLLADDNKVFLDALLRLLAPDCDIVATAGDGLAAVTLTAQYRPDVVVLDMMMPRMSGLDAARHISVRYPGVKVIFMTGSWDPELRDEACRTGASAFFYKHDLATELPQTIFRLARKPAQ